MPDSPRKFLVFVDDLSWMLPDQVRAAIVDEDVLRRLVTSKSSVDDLTYERSMEAAMQKVVDEKVTIDYSPDRIFGTR